MVVEIIWAFDEAHIFPTGKAKSKKKKDVSCLNFYIFILFALPIFKTPHSPHLTFSTLHTTYLLHSPFSKLPIFHSLHFLHSVPSTHSTYTGRFQFPLLDAVHCVSTKCLMAVLSDCSPSSSCLLSLEYWNLVQNNNNIRVKETKM